MKSPLAKIKGGGTKKVCLKQKKKELFEQKEQLLQKASIKDLQKAL